MIDVIQRGNLTRSELSKRDTAKALEQPVIGCALASSLIGSLEMLTEVKNIISRTVVKRVHDGCVIFSVATNECASIAAKGARARADSAKSYGAIRIVSYQPIKGARKTRSED